MDAPKIVLYGHFGSGNIGNDSSFEAALSHIRKLLPHASITCICNGPDEITRRFHINTIPIDASEGKRHGDSKAGKISSSFIKRVLYRITDEIGFWLKRPVWFRTVDLFIIVGTGAVDDMAIRWPWNAPFDLYKWCRSAKLGGAKVVFLSVGVGPIVNRISRLMMLRALRLADYRSYREKFAIKYLNSVGFDSAGDPVFPDLVFGLPESHTNQPPPTLNGLKTVGLGVINYYGWRHDPGAGGAIYQAYLSKIKGFVSWLLEKGYRIRLLVGDSTDVQPLNEILAFARKAGKSRTADQILVEEIATVKDLLNQISQTDYIVASRFHNVVCALMLLKPVVSLGYHDKNEELMTDIGLQILCQHIEDFTLKKLIEQFEYCEKESDQIKVQIQSRLDKYRQLLEIQYRDILSPWMQN